MVGYWGRPDLNEKAFVDEAVDGARRQDRAAAFGEAVGEGWVGEDGVDGARDLGAVGHRLQAGDAVLDDLSDATVEVVRRQLGYDLGEVDWPHLDTTGPKERTLAQARRILGLEKT